MTTLAIVILTFFIIKHFIADFLLQFPYMIEQKGTYGAQGGIDHAAVHAAFTFMILSFTMNPLLMLLGALADAVSHYHIDWAKMNIGKGLTPADKMFWVWIGADQLLHYLTYVAIVAVIL